MNKILVLFAHPALHKSRVQVQLLKAARQVEHVTIRDLYEHYPDFMIDVEQEQQLLLDHDIILFQHPFYWYSSPALIKEWQDLVLEHGFAYGTDGLALSGKKMFNAISCGGTEESYNARGENHFTIRELLRPFEQTALLCGIQYLSPFVIHGSRSLEDPSIKSYADDYKNLLTQLSQRLPDEKECQSMNYLNEWIEA